MLGVFRDLATASGIEHEAIEGRWPDDEGRVQPADVVLCHHVFYMAPDLRSFCDVLTRKARRRVVVELLQEHPRAWMNPLWMRFHGLERPTRPTADDAVAALREAGIAVKREDVVDERKGEAGTREDAVAFVRRTLCLGADRDPEVAEALGDDLWEADGGWFTGPRVQQLVTLFWDAPR